METLHQLLIAPSSSQMASFANFQSDLQYTGLSLIKSNSGSSWILSRLKTYLQEASA